MWNFPDITPLFYLAIVGLVAIGVTILGGVGFVVWFIVNHVQIV